MNQFRKRNRICQRANQKGEFVSLSALKSKALQDPEVKEIYEGLRAEFELINSLISSKEKSELAGYQGDRKLSKLTCGQKISQRCTR